ncbi:sigma-70 family RNA polymerase sigma factor [Metabacillus mangrovi]|nr:sigma-70 family RNA polymerase sigma factor [Metabacillus mangrovi]
MKFSELLDLYKPMILHLMKRLCIYRNHEEFFQTACIALWEASNQYLPEKGSKDAYFYLFIKGRLMNEMTRQNQLISREDLKESVDLDMCTSVPFPHENEPDWDVLAEGLTENQKKWFHYHICLGDTITEIAEKEGTTPAAVKGWRRDALRKLKEKLQLET